MKALSRFASPLALAVFVVLALVPQVVSNLYYLQVVTLALLFGLFVISWDLLSGCTDELNFGHGFFIASGGYVAALMNLHLDAGPWLTLPAAALTAAAFGFLAGWLTLRTKGPHFALMTIALSAMLYKISFIYRGVFGGEEGISGVDFLSATPVRDYYLAWLFLILAYLVLYYLVHSLFGLTLRAIKANEEAAQASGINTAFYKITAFTISGLFAGLGGALFTHIQGQITAEMTSAAVSSTVVLMGIIGSRGTITGPLIAAIVLNTLNEGLRVVEQYRILLYTGALVLALWLFPDGVGQGLRELWHRRRHLPARAEGRMRGAAVDGR